MIDLGKPTSGVLKLGGVSKKRYIQALRAIEYLYLQGPKTTTEISQTLQVSMPNSINMINELMSSDILEKRGVGPSIGGRKPDLYGLREDTFYVMAIEMERFVSKVAIYNNANVNITGTREVAFSVVRDMQNDDSLAHLYAEAAKIIASSGIDSSRLLGVGLVMPGLIDSDKGINHTYPTRGEAAIKEVLEEKFGIPVFVENIAKSIALAEHRFGKARDKRNVLVISLNWGIGLGMILDGKLYKGETGFAGEFSHMPMEEEGVPCPCGKRGCLETVASGFALVRLAKQGVVESKSIILSQLSEGDIEKITPALVLAAATKGDHYSLEILAEIGHKLGKGISMLIQLLNPELIVLDGVLAHAEQLLTIPIQQSLNIYCMPQLGRQTRIELSDLGKDVAILGAVAVAMEHVFKRMIDTI